MFDWLRRQESVDSENGVSRAAHEHSPVPQPPGGGQVLSGADGRATEPVADAVGGGPCAEEIDELAAGERDPEGIGQHEDQGIGQDEDQECASVDPGIEESESNAASRGREPEPLGSPSVSPVAPLAGRRRGRRLVQAAEVERAPLTAEQRLWILDLWKRSGLPAGDFAPLVGLSKHTLYGWKKQFTAYGPAGLMEQKRGVREGSRLPELTKRTILLLKESHPEWGCERISAMLERGPALPASASAVARVLHEAGYKLEEVAVCLHRDRVRHFEREKPNQLWQTDLFTFVLKRQNRRVYLVGFMDDHSRFLVSYGLHASQSTALVLEVLRAAITSYGAPEEILTDNGAQYVTWRGKSQFTKELEKRGIRQIVATPRRPQTLGKIERFWGTLWRECVETAVFIDLADAQARIGHFIDYYNFQRAHGGIDGLVPADRFFGAATDVLRTLKERVASNACELARHGVAKPPFYMTGQVGGQSFSVHAEGERVILRREDGVRHEVDLVAPNAAESGSVRDATAAGGAAEAARSGTVLPAPVCPHGSPQPESPSDIHEAVPAPGVSPLDEAVDELGAARRRADERTRHDGPSARKDGDA